ncbi:chitin binding peritrophin-A-like protein [Chitinophaga dinghuensis]|uniref:Chitin binding peritrophin-A-like protein n=1 Tax=Chitinophaga dinghuensis TaxID=1539050 RepID=A0A327VSU4_9BACT|nr:carbohydrate-binding module family 14 protein [Chitinophaga dinghuensis]RAJ77484.1 chitin binding peritrophin-A-like protein [Chitinophaga dinghuensis]
MKKMFLGATAVLLTLAAIAAPKKPCSEPGEIIADNTYCEIFYICGADLYPEKYYCPIGLVFNETKKVCNLPAEGGCE